MADFSPYLNALAEAEKDEQAREWQREYMECNHRIRTARNAREAKRASGRMLEIAYLLKDAGWRLEWVKHD